MQWVIIGIIAARPGCIRIRVSREISLGPNTKPASLVSESLDAAASLSASSTARAVSIMAQTRIDMSALMSLRRFAMALRSATVEILGTRMPTGRALPTMVTSSTHQGVSRLLTRISTSRLPNPPAAIALAIWLRAIALAYGATEFAQHAGSDLRRRPRRALRGTQRRQSGAGLPAGRRRPWYVGVAGICSTGATRKTHRGARPCAMRRHPCFHRRYRSADAGRLHRP